MKVVVSLVSVTAAVALLALPAGAEPGFSPVQSLPAVKGAGTQPIGYASISCPKAGDCTVVGPVQEGDFGHSGGVPTEATETSGKWGSSKSIAFPSGSTASSSTLAGVSCDSPGNCAAVGTLDQQGGKPLVVSSTSGTWKTASTVVLPGSATGGALDAVSCVAVGSCTAVGTYTTSATLAVPFVTTATSNTWATGTSLPSSPGALLTTVSSVSCLSATSCSAFGVAYTSGSGSSIVWSETGGTWGTPVAIAQPKGSSFIGFSGVCPSLGTCVLVGGLGIGSRVFLAAATEKSGTWSSAAEIASPQLSPHLAQGQFSSVSCVSLSDCVAVGELLSSSNLYWPSAAVADTWSGGKWSSGDIFNQPVGGKATTSALFSSLSCSLGCTAIGVGLSKNAESATGILFATAVTAKRTVTKPGPPARVQIAPGGSTVKVSWLPPTNDGGSPVEAFAAQLVSGAAHCHTSTLSCTLGGLVKGHRYEVQVRSITIAGESAPTSSKSFVAK